MGDFLTPDERSRRMSLIRSTGTKPEIAMHRLLSDNALRSAAQVRELPGKPDFQLLDYRVVIFVNGDFWHGHGFLSWQHKLNKSWHLKIISTMRRDDRHCRKLRKLGYSVVNIWESDLRKRPKWCLARILRAAKQKAN